MAANVGIIILAAGGSSRMGTPKQLLPFHGVSLLRHAALTALQTACRPIVVVLGAQADMMCQELDDLDIRIVENHAWQTGMSGSLRAGLNALLEEEKGRREKGKEDAVNSSFLLPPSACLVILCDQPFVKSELLNTLVETWQRTGQPIAACEYDGTVGVPALFDRSLFPELLALEGAAGAKQIFARHAGKIARAAFPQGRFDIDTPEDWSRALRG